MITAGFKSEADDFQGHDSAPAVDTHLGIGISDIVGHDVSSYHSNHCISYLYMLDF